MERLSIADDADEEGGRGPLALHARGDQAHGRSPRRGRRRCGGCRGGSRRRRRVGRRGRWRRCRCRREGNRSPSATSLPSPSTAKTSASTSSTSAAAATPSPVPRDSGDAWRQEEWHIAFIVLVRDWNSSLV